MPDGNLEIWANYLDDSDPNDPKNMFWWIFFYIYSSKKTDLNKFRSIDENSKATGSDLTFNYRSNPLQVHNCLSQSVRPANILLQGSLGNENLNASYVNRS